MVTLVEVDDYLQGMYDEARPLYGRAIKVGEKTLGPEYPDFALWLHNFATSLMSEVDLGERSRVLLSAHRESTTRPSHNSNVL